MSAIGNVRYWRFHCKCTCAIILVTNVHVIHLFTLFVPACTCRSCVHVHVGSSPTRGSSFFLGKVTALSVLCCFALFVCLTLLASFFLPSHLSFKNTYMLYICSSTLLYIVHVQTKNMIFVF